MQSLVYYCRWRSAKLRLRGRDDSAVWGELVYESGTAAERTQRFQYDLKRREIVVDTDAGQTKHLLDEMGVVVETGAEASSSAGDEPQ